MAEARGPVTLDQQQFGAPGADVDLSAYQSKQMAAAAEVPQGALSVASFGGVVTAQRVAVPRNLETVKNKIKVLANMGGDKFYYHWMVKERKTGKRVPVQGLSIKGANDVAREWGNCQVDIRMSDEGKYWTFYARFTDLETGYSLTRPFRQRKGSDIGEGYDAERKLDMIFQVGASKAIRNVVVNALQTVADFAFEEAMGSVKKRVAANPEGARQHLQQQIQQLGIQMDRVVRIYQRQPNEWTVPDMARLFSELQSIREGMATVEDVFPTEPVDVGGAPEPKETRAPEQKRPAPTTAAPQAPTTATTEDAYPKRVGPGKFDWVDRDGINYGAAVESDGSFLFGYSKQNNMPSHADGSFRAARGRQEQAEKYRRHVIQTKAQGQGNAPEPEPAEPEGPADDTNVTSDADTDAWRNDYNQAGGGNKPASELHSEAPPAGQKSPDDDWNLD